jgi:predicted nucleotide-binding protein
MADGAAIRRAIREKTGFTPQHINRLVQAKMQSDLLSRDHASMAIAIEMRINVNKFVDDADWAAVRGAQSGSPSAPAMSATPPARAVRASSANKPRISRAKSGRTVMVVYGRDDQAKQAMFDFLKSLDLKPMSWTQGISQTKIANPSVRQIVDALFAKAVAVVVLLTPDDEAQLKPKFRKKNEPAHEVQLTGQARPNVLFEAGMAMSSHPEQTVMTQIGNVKPFTDVGGIHITHLNNSLDTRRELATKLKNAKCQIDMDDDKWRTAGDFELGEEEDTNG